ncbi:ABC-three component system middle component 8 [Halalkalibacter alkalisediminis]|uniref:ABC-three component system middle component 8 n=1 Tax=Halalkalibacter alkalisediminis TaxID=935616 RepID=A0ABV6NMN1_9BACI|nr:ABC-three component system middle component 8 [Halalkalibacter alkalisediminis]
MLRPDKFTDLNRSLIFAVALLIKVFKENDYKCGYGNLYNALEKQIGDDALYLFLPAVDFLFLLGRVDYDIESDVLEMKI